MQPKDSDWKFVDDKRTPVYKTDAAELDAIAKGKKPISFFATDRTGLDDDLAEIEPLAKKRGLTTTVSKRKDAIDIFVHREDGARLIPPLQALLSKSPWSFEHEASLGTLLGYSPKQSKDWLAAEHHARPGFGVLTLYADIVAGYPFPLEWWSNPGRVTAPDAYKAMDRSVPGLQLWRVGVDPAYAKHLDKKGFISLAGASKAVNATFDSAVHTELEWLGPAGWHRPVRSKTKLRKAAKTRTR